jgi:hypothetical protein
MPHDSNAHQLIDLGVLVHHTRLAAATLHCTTPLLQVEADQGRTEVKSWPCPAPVHGSDATQFKPGLTADDRLTVWVGDIFQAADLVVNKSTELHSVKLLRYWLVSCRGHEGGSQGLATYRSSMGLSTSHHYLQDESSINWCTPYPTCRIDCMHCNNCALQVAPVPDPSVAAFCSCGRTLPRLNPM